MPEKFYIPRPYVNINLIQQLGVKNIEYFNESFDALCKRWWDGISSRADTVGGMLVTSKLTSHLNEPLIISIIADDIECFKKHYNKSKDIFCLDFSCLCGSEKIIKEFYLQGNNQKILLLSKNAIAYALSSGKKELALSLAKKAIELNKSDPGQLLLYSFGDYLSAKTIKQMFIYSKSSSNNATLFADDPNDKEQKAKKPKLN